MLWEFGSGCQTTGLYADLQPRDSMAMSSFGELTKARERGKRWGEVGEVGVEVGPESGPGQFRRRWRLSLWVCVLLRRRGLRCGAGALYCALHSQSKEGVAVNRHCGGEVGITTAVGRAFR